MSGICGIIRLDGQPGSSRDLERQTRRMAHLGPDRVSSICDGPAALAHLMMRTTQEDRIDAQPLRHGDLSLVADVRLDNREELAAALAIERAVLKNMPDSALLFAAYRRWGDDCVEHLVGDFVFAVWDAARRVFTMARDHMGQRHVFYHQGGGFFAFATEIKGLWALPEVPRILIEERIAMHLLFDQPKKSDAGTTDYEGIRALPGGTILTLGPDGEVATRRYWEPHADPKHIGRDEDYYIATYRQVLSEAVACRLRRATHPGGLFNGGGFDSSAICALAGPAVAPNGLKFISVSSVMPEDYRGPIRDCRRWVEMCRRITPHLEVRYVTREGLDIFTFMEEGFLTGDNRHSPNRYVSHAMFAELKAAGVRIVMDGHGGDYTVNPRGQNALARMLLKCEFRRFLSEFRAMRRHLKQSRLQTVRRNVIAYLVPAWWWQFRMRRRNGLAPFGPTFPLSRQIIARKAPKASSLFSSEPGAPPSLMMERVLRSQQDAPAQAYSTSGAQHGLEFTQPFHDKRVVEFGLAIPEELYVKNGKTRFLAREALKDLYPPEYQERLPGNDPLVPDFSLMATRVRPRILGEIDRMEKSLSQYFDFSRMREMLTRSEADQCPSDNPVGVQQALLAFLAARYIEWFRGENG